MEHSNNCFITPKASAKVALLFSKPASRYFTESLFYINLKENSLEDWLIQTTFSSQISYLGVNEGTVIYAPLHFFKVSKYLTHLMQVTTNFTKLHFTRLKCRRPGT